MIEMEKYWRKNPDQKFFICADDDMIYNAIISKYPDKMSKSILYVNKSTFDRSLEQLRSAVVDVFLLRKCQIVLGSPWSSFTELVARLGSSNILTIGKDFANIKHGLLFYPTSRNIGDVIQSIAAAQYLPVIDYLIDRDDQTSEIYDTNGEHVGKIDDILNGDKQIKLIENGWFDGRLTKFPPNNKIIPLFISFHINESEDLFNEINYQSIAGDAKMDESLLGDNIKLEYFRQYNKHRGPIGARDANTRDMLISHNIKSIHTSCLTLTLKRTVPTKPIRPDCCSDSESEGHSTASDSETSDKENENIVQPLYIRDFQWKKTPNKKFVSSEYYNQILVVDAHISEPELFLKLVPEHIRKSAKYILHGCKELLSYNEKQVIAEDLLIQYQTAKMVITSRLHCALPCLAYGTPCIFLYAKMETDCRFDDTLKTLLGHGNDIPKSWNWNHPMINKRAAALARALAKNLRKQANKFISF